MASLSGLPDEIVCLIVQHMCLPELSHFAATSRKYYNFCHNQLITHRRLRQDHYRLLLRNLDWHELLSYFQTPSALHYLTTFEVGATDSSNRVPTDTTQGHRAHAVRWIANMAPVRRIISDASWMFDRLSAEDRLVLVGQGLFEGLPMTPNSPSLDVPEELIRACETNQIDRVVLAICALAPNLRIWRLDAGTLHRRIRPLMMRLAKAQKSPQPALSLFRNLETLELHAVGIMLIRRGQHLNLEEVIPLLALPSLTTFRVFNFSFAELKSSTWPPKDVPKSRLRLVSIMGHCISYNEAMLFAEWLAGPCTIENEDATSGFKSLSIRDEGDAQELWTMRYARQVKGVVSMIEYPAIRGTDAEVPPRGVVVRMVCGGRDYEGREY